MYSVQGGGGDSTAAAPPLNWSLSHRTPAVPPHTQRYTEPTLRLGMPRSSAALYADYNNGTRTPVAWRACMLLLTLLVVGGLIGIAVALAHQQPVAPAPPATTTVVPGPSPTPIIASQVANDAVAVATSSPLSLRLVCNMHVAANNNDTCVAVMTYENARSSPLIVAQGLHNRVTLHTRDPSGVHAHSVPLTRFEPGTHFGAAHYTWPCVTYRALVWSVRAPGAAAPITLHVANEERACPSLESLLVGGSVPLAS